MGIIRKAAVNIIKGAAIYMGLSAAGKGLEGGSGAGETIRQKAGSIRETVNRSLLRNRLGAEDYCLFITAERNLGEGIYRAVDRSGKERYNTLMEHIPYEDFALHFYESGRGEILSVRKYVTMKKGLIALRPVGANYVMYLGDSFLGEVFAYQEGGRKVYVNGFNDWVAAGDFGGGNYKIFSTSTGKTIAAVSRQFASADTYMMVCAHDENEPVAAAITMLLDIIEKG